MRVLDGDERANAAAMLMDVWPFECAIQRAEATENEDGSVTAVLGEPENPVPCSIVMQRLRSGLAGAEPGVTATRRVYVRLPEALAGLTLRSRVRVYVRGSETPWSVYDVDGLPMAAMASVLVPVKDVGEVSDDFTS